MTKEDKLHKIPGLVLEALRERGHDDEAISSMQPQTMFSEYCEWHGLIGYGQPLWKLVVKLQKLS